MFNVESVCQMSFSILILSTISPHTEEGEHLLMDVRLVLATALDVNNGVLLGGQPV